MAGIHLPKGKSFIMVEETGIGKGSPGTGSARSLSRVGWPGTCRSDPLAAVHVRPHAVGFLGLRPAREFAP